MSIAEDTDDYETWLRRQCAVVEAHLDLKHAKMRKSPFAFLRATYYRWARRIEAVCPELAEAPPVLAVGDTHLENFGTWRDAEGRLVWGVNDFDEAAVMPYALDLVRLAASVRLAPRLALRNRTACRAIFEGYRRGLDRPRPTLLDEHESWMRPFVACSDRERNTFWREIDGLPRARPPRAVAIALRSLLPPGASAPRFAARAKGSGGLGRPRYVVIADWRGGRVVREARALVGSAWDWAHGGGAERPRFLDLAAGPHRSPDPCLRQSGTYVCRRVATDSRKVELGPRAGAGLKTQLLEAMGFDLGAIHAADPACMRAIGRDLRARPRNWLSKASKAAAIAIEDDYRDWVR